ncbi:hypothetical protein G3I13_24110 [Streptomyces sp. SID6673]|nr:hypothetical protein [Streptomyces sp. SID11726]NEB27434.1 hypothetical protein [Streptomyces sp. SID6673]
MVNDSGVRTHRNQGWSACAMGVVALLVSVASPAILQMRNDAWVDDALRTRCRDLAELPPATLFGALQITFAVIAAIAFVVSWRRARPAGAPTLLIAIAAVLFVVAVLVIVYGALIVVDAPTSPFEGVDGSGVPCGSG